MEFIYLVPTRMVGESYHRWLRSLLLHLCDVLWEPINFLVCWLCTNTLGLVLFQTVKARLSTGSVSVVFLLVSFYADCIVLAVCVSARTILPLCNGWVLTVMGKSFPLTLFTCLVGVLWCVTASMMGCKRNIMSPLSFNCLLFVDFVDLGGEGNISHWQKRLISAQFNI